MPKILLVSGRPGGLDALEKALGSYPSVTLVKAENPGDALKIAGTEKPELAVVDSKIPGCPPEKLVADFLRVNAMMNTALVSSMDEDEFHEKTEGLGIMMSLPENPGPKDAARLIEKLAGIIGG